MAIANVVAQNEYYRFNQERRG